MRTKNRIPIRCSVYAVAILCFLAFAVTDTMAQKKEYPERPVKILVTTGPGGVGDLWVRAWSEEYSRILKTPMVIVNEGGASGRAALIEAAKAKPDGYTLVDITQSLVVGFAISSKPSFDLFKDFVALGALGSFPTLIAVEKSSPFATFDDLVDYAKNNPGKLRCASSGVTMIGHFNFELVKQHMKLDIVTVPFRTGPQAVTAFLGKHVDLITLPPQSLIGHLKAGRARALLTTQKLKDYPNVPLFSEKGMTEAGLSSWIGMFAPSGIEKDIQKKLTDSFERLSKDPKVIERIENLGFTPEYLSPAQLTEKMKTDFQKIKAVAKEAGIREE